MEKSDYTKIYSGSFIIVQLIVDKLQAIGINAIVKDVTESGRGTIFGTNAVNYQDLYVNNDELDQSTRIVEDVTAEMES